MSTQSPAIAAGFFSMPSLRSALRVGLAASATAIFASSAFAGFNDSIAFGQAGNVTVTIDNAGGGFDHVLELANNVGPIGSSPIFYLSDGTPGNTVLGNLAALPGQSASLGAWGAGQELIFRLTNVESARLGTPGNLGGQVLTGSASSLNSTPTGIYSLVEFESPTKIHVTVEDLFPGDATTPPTIADFKNSSDVSFTLTLTPVPEPETYAMVLAGLLTVGALLRKKSA